MQMSSAEAVCMLTGMAPVEHNVQEVQRQWGASSSAAASPAPSQYAGAAAASVDELNCMLTGMPPTASNIRSCETARVGPDNASFSSVASGGDQLDEITCLLSGMPPTHQNVAMAAQQRYGGVAPAQQAPGGAEYPLTSLAQQGISNIPRPIARKLSVRRMATMLGPM
eukprot:TRINITY_DN20667_c0_g1_i2.p3 TRINITY_DN20667_c0_g1~~TRINITY_DN20667_c0_g1_i2.p3  ORF type:complete len:168 (+),score=51.26 TRINITY_DN20667_c0_g1_i2:180-683(+)